MPAHDEPTQTGDDRAGDVLALPADVEEAAAERERDREPGEDQRRRQDQRLRQVVRRERVRVVFHQKKTRWCVNGRSMW